MVSPATSTSFNLNLTSWTSTSFADFDWAFTYVIPIERPKNTDSLKAGWIKAERRAQERSRKSRAAKTLPPTTSRHGNSHTPFGHR
jgi:hypothetical protein